MKSNRTRRPLLSAALAACSVAAACSPSELKEPPPQGPSAYRAQVLADLPAAYWRLDEPAGTVMFDQMPNNNRGKIMKGVTLAYAAGATADGDSAMAFDGLDGQIEVPNSASLQIRGGSVTLEAWIRPLALQTGQVMIMAKGTAGVQTEYALALMDGVPAYQAIAEIYVAKAPPLTAGMWSYVVATVAANKELRLYVNGQEAGIFPITTNHAVTTSTQPLVLGNEAASMARFAGVLDEMAIYPAALTAEQVARHFSSAKQSR
jgi:concanavalin A-like lectin/glucanase superfamily protein